MLRSVVKNPEFITSNKQSASLAQCWRTNDISIFVGESVFTALHAAQRTRAGLGGEQRERERG